MPLRTLRNAAKDAKKFKLSDHLFLRLGCQYSVGQVPDADLIDRAFFLHPIDSRKIN